MFANKSASDLENMFGGVALATAVLNRNEDSEWSIYWQNNSANSLWGSYLVDEDFELKLALLDAMTRAGASSFVHKLPNAVQPFRFTASPEENSLLIQFLPEKSNTEQQVDRRQEDVYKLVVEGSRLGIFDWNILEDYISFSDRVYDICSISPSEMGSTQEDFFQRVHSDDIEDLKEAFETHIESRWPFDVEFRVQTSMGHYIWVQASGQAVYSQQTGKAIRFAGMLLNISERKAAEEKVVQREALIEQIIDSLPISIYVKDDRGCFRFYSKQTEVETGIARSEAIGRTDYEVFPIDIARQQVMGDQLAKEENRIVITEEEMKTSGGNRWLMIGKGPIKVVKQGKESTWILGFSLDITQRKAIEEMLKLARDEAEKAAKAKSEFLSVMSHEIRTPLNSVIGTSSLLLDTELPPEQMQHAEMIKRSGEHLLHLINDILDFNKLDAGKMELENRAMNLHTQCETAVSISRANAQLKNLPVVLDYSSDLGRFYKGDEARLRQILLNLLGNAVKFTEQGQVSLKVYSVKQGSLINRLRFEVTDTGIGIPADKVNSLFSEFSQVDASTTRKFGGTGLGLSICKKLVEAMEGEIGILSDFGQGSTFWFEIDMNSVSDEEAQATLAEDLPDLDRELNILVAEDNIPNQLLIKAILGKLGHKVELVANGKKAVEAIEVGTTEFDLVLMDMQMPEMDGLEATGHIRLLDSESSQLPIIALTANALAGDRERVLDAGMNDYLTKPIDIKALKRALKIWGNRTL